MDFLKELNTLALASRMKRVVEKLNSDMKSIYRENNIDFEPFLMPVMKLLKAKGALSITEIVEYLGISQPAVTQLCSVLLDKKLIKAKNNVQDKRKREVELSKQGTIALADLFPVWNEVEASVEAMLSTSDHNLIKAIDDFETQYKLKTLKQRVLENLNKHKSSTITIVSYKEGLKEDFKKLNHEWITRNFIVEETDKHVLSNPEKSILSKGGHIFFAKYNKEIVGTFALIRVDDTTYEIGKMAVTEKYQRLGIGQRLLDHAVLKAKSMKLKRLILYSNTLLASAINLYFKNGFKVIPKTDFHNNRANIKMEKIL